MDRLLAFALLFAVWAVNGSILYLHADAQGRESLAMILSVAASVMLMASMAAAISSVRHDSRRVV